MRPTCMEPSSGDPAVAALVRMNAANRARLMGYLAGRPVVQIRDLWAEAGLGRDRYAGNEYMELVHAERLLGLGYCPVVIPAASGAANVLVFVRGPWPLDAHTGTIHPRLRSYLEDGDPLMALLVGRVQREMNLAAAH